MRKQVGPADVNSADAAVTNAQLNSTVSTVVSTTVYSVVENAVETLSARLNFTFIQALPATQWIIRHEMGFDPAGISAYAADGDLLEGFGVVIDDPGAQLRLTFDIPLAGSARLS